MIAAENKALGKYQPYPEYKDSGVEFLGGIPVDWQMKILKYETSFSGGGTPAKDNLTYWGGDIPWISPKDMKSLVISDSIDKITSIAVIESSTKLVSVGSLLMVVRSGILQRTIPVAINTVPVTLNQDMKALQFGSKEQAKFFLYYVQGLEQQLLLEWCKQGATVESIEHELLANSRYPVPPKAGLEVINQFLDYETARIDRLIAKQQQLIALLKEKRQAVISHAVTKGLNPDAPMKDSGVEWLGQVPEHWTMTRLKYECSHIVDCPHSTPKYDDEGEFSAIRTADIFAGLLDLQNTRRVSKDVYDERNLRLVPIAGDIIYSREGERFGIGACIPQNAKVCLAQRVMLFRAKNTSNFIMWALNSISTYNQAKQDCIGSTAPHVNVETINNFILAWPPENERAEIAKHIDKMSSRMDILVNLATNKVNLLQERRTALISAAVTGKIDLRDWELLNG